MITKDVDFWKLALDDLKSDTRRAMLTLKIKKERKRTLENLVLCILINNKYNHDIKIIRLQMSLCFYYPREYD